MFGPGVSSLNWEKGFFGEKELQRKNKLEFFPLFSKTLPFRKKLKAELGTYLKKRFYMKPFLETCSECLKGITVEQRSSSRTRK